MNFGSLQIATLWRLRKDGFVRQAIVVESAQGPRLVIVEADQHQTDQREADKIIQWERFVLAGELRKRAVELGKQHRKIGWVPVDD